MTNLVIELKDDERQYKWKVVSQRENVVLGYYYTKKRAWRALDKLDRESPFYEPTVVPIDYEWYYNKEYNYYTWGEPKNE